MSRLTVLQFASNSPTMLPRAATTTAAYPRGAFPTQGRGNTLKVEINGVDLSLGWNGGNSPGFPRKPKTANYRRERLTPQQIALLKGLKPPKDPKPLPDAERTFSDNPDPDRVIEATFRQSWIWWRASVTKKPDWVSKLAMKSNAEVRLRGDKGQITKDWIWLNGVRLRFLDIGKPFCVCKIDGELARMIRDAG